MKILLSAFKLSVGNQEYINSLETYLIKKNIDFHVCHENNYRSQNKIEKSIIGHGMGPFQMMADTLNPLNLFKFFKLTFKKFSHIIFVASHSLNIIQIIIFRIFNKTKIISIIHDPLPHSGRWYSFLILISQRIQVALSDLIVVHGKKLKQDLIDYYKVSDKKILNIKLAASRRERDSFNDNLYEKKYFSLVGRIEDYKGVDIFLKAADVFYKTNPNIKFIIAGKGNMDPYKKLVTKFKTDSLIIKNYQLTIEELDTILASSHACVLPYKEGTQTGIIAVSYYNGTPVIVSDVGSLTENVVKNETGIVIRPNDVNELVSAFEKILHQNKHIMREKSFNYYKKYFRWNIILDRLLEEIR
tara:strand:- start:25 stop:1098 length:1074 start_codon:yes stop_codon:yes gene_type:complete